MSRRVQVNLAVFVLVFLALSWWTVRNVVRFDVIDRPYRVIAEFETSPGLRSEFEVTYLGVSVGRIGRVDLVDDRVEVELKIRREVELPSQLTAAVQRKSAVGEPFVELAPMDPDGADVRVPPGSRLREGDRIPLERTTTPLSYAELFEALDDLLTAVEPDDIDTLLSELAAGLGGQGPALRSLLVDLDDLTGTLAAEAPLLDAAISDLTRLTATLTEHRTALVDGVDDVALLVETLAAHRGDVAALLDRGPELAGAVSGLLADVRVDLGCTLDALGAVTPRLAQPRVLDALHQVLVRAPQAVPILRAVQFAGPDGLWVSTTFAFNFGESSVEVYDQPRTLPAVPAVGTCSRTASGPGGAAGPDAPVAPGTGGAGRDPGASPRTPVPDREAPGEDAAPSSDLDTGGDGFPLLAVPAMLALLVAAWLLARRRPWAALLGRRGDGD